MDQYDLMKLSENEFNDRDNKVAWQQHAFVYTHHGPLNDRSKYRLDRDPETIRKAKLLRDAAEFNLKRNMAREAKAERETEIAAVKAMTPVERKIYKAGKVAANAKAMKPKKALAAAKRRAKEERRTLSTMRKFRQQAAHLR